jgi:hypothetical protein
MISYIIAFIILFISFFLYCHISRLKSVNNELRILQVGDSTPELIFELLQQQLPIVYQRELYAWKRFNKLIGKPLNEIQSSINSTNIDNEVSYSDSIKNNLEPNNLPLSYDWDIDIKNVILDDKSSIFFIKQNNYMQTFGCVTGEFRIIISPPSQSHYFGTFINNVSNVNAIPLLEKNPIELEFLEIIIRAGNMIYIPYNWHYFIYKNNKEIETVIIDCINKSILSNIP